MGSLQTSTQGWVPASTPISNPSIGLFSLSRASPSRKGHGCWPFQPSFPASLRLVFFFSQNMQKVP